MSEYYTTFDAAKILGIKRTRIQEWIDSGFIKPHQRSVGKGDKTLFTHIDLCNIQLMAMLTKEGISRNFVKEQIEKGLIDWESEYRVLLAIDPQHIKRFIDKRIKKGRNEKK